MNETFAVGRNQDLTAAAKATSFFRVLQEKESMLKFQKGVLKKFTEKYKGL